MAEENFVKLYGTDGGAVQRVPLAENTYAVQFRVSAPVSGARIYVAKANSTGDKGSMSAALYAWAGSYGKSVNGQALAKESFEKLATGDHVTFSFGTVGAGEYVLALYGGGGNMHVGLSDGGESRTYMNASVHPLSLMAEIVWEKEAGELLPCSENEPAFVVTADTWVATDGLGRKIENSETDTRREGKYVGLFFHTWHTSNSGLGSRNITEILKEHPGIQNDFRSPLWGNAGAYHWNEPIWGYYRSCDEWVLRRQAELLADAGVDAVFFDNTNGTATFIDDVLTLCRV